MTLAPAPEDRLADILLITALSKELDWFSKTIGVRFERTARQGTSYLRGIHRVGDRELSIVAVRQLDKGPTSAAVTATKAICLWQPSVVVMTGICAGVEHSVALGDLVVAVQCFEHASGQLVDGDIVPLQNRVALEPWFQDYLMSISDSPAFATTIQEGYPGLLPQDFAMRIHYGPMACGPLVVKDPQYMAKVRSHEHALLALDMESYGVALAASMCSTPARPVHAVIVKGVVDYADGAKNDDWHDYAAYASAAYARRILETTYERPVAFAQITRTRADEQSSTIPRVLRDT
jgi:nucleoside phosphorylase